MEVISVPEWLILCIAALLLFAAVSVLVQICIWWTHKYK